MTASPAFAQGRQNSAYRPPTCVLFCFMTSRNSLSVAVVPMQPSPSMSLIKEYRWTFPEQPESEDSLTLQETAKRLGDELGVSPVLAEILSRRGVHTFEEARSFFRPGFSDLNDPFLMHDMDRAVERIVRALKTREPILIYGDYDVDGTNGTTLLWTFLKSVGGTVSYFIPDRIKDGYGLSRVGVDRAK